MPSPFIEVKSLPFPGTGEGGIFTNRNFFYKCKFPLQKENLCTVFRAFPASAATQWYLTQNNPYAKEAYFAVAYSGTPHSAL